MTFHDQHTVRKLILIFTIVSGVGGGGGGVAGAEEFQGVYVHTIAYSPLGVWNIVVESAYILKRLAI